MKRMLLTAAASMALAIPVSGAFAQQTTTAADAAGSSYQPTAQQRTIYEGWPADRRTSYDAWPDTYKTYYWALTPDQQSGWWALDDTQRGQVYAMTPEQRSTTWASIASQMGAASTAATASNATTSTTASSADSATGADMTATPEGTTTTTTTAADAPGMTTSASADMAMASAPATGGPTQFVRREMTQPVAASADAAALASGNLPVCKKGQQDGCINSYEKTGRGTKPLNYWPGRPASETASAKPDPR